MTDPQSAYDELFSALDQAGQAQIVRELMTTPHTEMGEKLVRFFPQQMAKFGPVPTHQAAQLLAQEVMGQLVERREAERKAYLEQQRVKNEAVLTNAERLRQGIG